MLRPGLKDALHLESERSRAQFVRDPYFLWERAAVLCLIISSGDRYDERVEEALRWQTRYTGFVIKCSLRLRNTNVKEPSIRTALHRALKVAIFHGVFKCVSL